MVLGLKPMGKPSTKQKNQKFWTEPRPCMVLGLKPMGKPSTKQKPSTSFGQNQGLAWSSDSSPWGNQVQVLDRTKALYGPRTQAYGEIKYKTEKSKVLDRTKALHGSRTQAYGETKYKKEISQVLDRTKALHGPRTQAYGETKYKKGKITSFGHN